MWNLIIHWKQIYKGSETGGSDRPCICSATFSWTGINKSVFLFSQGYFCFTSLQFKLGRANILWHGHSPSLERKLWYGKSKPNRGIPHPLWCSLSFGSQKGWGHRTSGVWPLAVCPGLSGAPSWRTVGTRPESSDWVWTPEPPLTCSVFWTGLQAPPSLFPDL